MSGTAKWRSILVAICFLALAVLPPVAERMGESFLIRQFIQIMVMGLAAMSLDLILGFGGLVSFGHAAFLGLGAYTVSILDFHASDGSRFLGLIPGSTDATIVWPAGILVAAIAALLIGIVCTRVSGIFFIMLTLAFAQMTFYTFAALTLYGADEGMSMATRSDTPFIDISDNTNFYYVVLATLLLSFLIMQRLTHARFGMVLRAIKQNERRLAAIGIPTQRYKLAAFVIAGAFAGLSGVLLANYQTFVSPGDLSWTRSGELTSMVVLGGIGSLFGPVLGATAYLLLQLIIGSYTTHWQAFFGPFLILVVLFARQGIFGILTKGLRAGAS